MNEQTKRKLQMSLNDIMRGWLQGEFGDIALPCLVGDNVAVYMADAALSVLVGIADTQAYLVSEGMMVDED